MTTPTLVFDRRTFLRAMGVAAGAVAAAPLLTGLGRVAAQDAPTGTTTIPDLALGLEYDSARIFRFVADEIGYDPYAGALRGVQGTLWSRAGNSVDQALLLAALLDEALVPYRFAMGPIDDPTAARLLAASALDTTTGRDRAAGTLLPPDIAAGWSGTGAWQRAADVDGLFAEAHAAADASVHTMLDALAGAGVALPAPAAPEIPALERERHVWIQIANGPDWLDLDPTIPTNEPGTAVGSAGDPLDALPDDLYHRVVVSLESEQVSGGAPVRSELLRHELRAADLPGVPVALVHPTPEWLGITKALTGEQQYSPTLLVGDQVVEGTRFLLGSSGGVTGALGDDSGNEGQAVAEWLTVDTIAPDGTTKSARRTVFDRVDADARAAGTFDVATLPPVDLVDAGADLGSVFLPLAGFMAMAATSHPVPWTLFASADGVAPDELALLGQVTHAFAYLRDLLRLETVAERAAPRFFHDEPAVTAFWSTPTGAAADGKRNLAVAVDILHAHHATAPYTDAEPAVAPGILAGAVDHAAERMVLEGTFSVTPEPPQQATFVSVGRLFELAEEQGIGVVVLKPGDQVAMAGAGVAMTAAIAAALDAGLVVVAPAAPIEVDGAPRIGWWEIDLTTGAARDRMDEGGGAGLGEYLEAIHEIATWGMCFVSLGAAIVSVCQGAINAGLAWGAVAVGQCIAAVAGGPPGAHLGH